MILSDLLTENGSRKFSSSASMKFNNYLHATERERMESPLIDGQFKQARIVDLFYNSSKFDGFFIEAGAYDGYTVSNSLFFEIYRGWKGLLVEAHPDNYDKLMTTNRKGTHLLNKLHPQIFSKTHFESRESLFSTLNFHTKSSFILLCSNI